MMFDGPSCPQGWTIASEFDPSSCKPKKSRTVSPINQKNKRS